MVEMMVCAQVGRMAEVMVEPKDAETVSLMVALKESMMDVFEVALRVFSKVD